MALTISRQDMWLPPPGRLHLESGAVHVWLAHLNQEPLTVQALRDTLAPDERQRADRYRFRQDREHFIVARGAIREILGRYLDTSPERIRFSYGTYGKPALSNEKGEGFLCFNVSHSHGLALFAVSRGREVGLDIEFIREDFATLEIAEHFFSAREVSMLRALPPDLQSAAFFNCWTRKEAYIKARGEGLLYPLDRFTVSLAPGEPAALLSSDDNPQESLRWTLSELSPGQGYAAALAVEGVAPTLHRWQWLR